MNRMIVIWQKAMRRIWKLPYHFTHQAAFILILQPLNLYVLLNIISIQVNLNIREDESQKGWRPVIVSFVTLFQSYSLFFMKSPDET
jgi:hypothetical protein